MPKWEWTNGKLDMGKKQWGEKIVICKFHGNLSNNSYHFCSVLRVKILEELSALLTVLYKYGSSAHVDNATFLVKEAWDSLSQPVFLHAGNMLVAYCSVDTADAASSGIEITIRRLKVRQLKECVSVCISHRSNCSLKANGLEELHLNVQGTASGNAMPMASIRRRSCGHSYWRWVGGSNGTRG